MSNATKKGAPKKTAQQTTAGGSATVAGVNFEIRIAAWAAALILAEREASPLWELSAPTTFTLLRLETEQPVDDLLVCTADGGTAFLQVKHSISLGSTATSDLASVFDQFVRQFIAFQGRAPGSQPWDHPLTAEKDRLVLVTGPSTPASVRVGLPQLLERIRLMPPVQRLQSAPLSEQQRTTLATIKSHINRAWRRATGTKPSEAELRHLLSVVRVEALDVTPGGKDEVLAKNILRTSILERPQDADIAWERLVAFCSQLAIQRGGADRMQMMQALTDAGIGLKAPPSYRKDIEQLKKHTTYTLGTLETLSTIAQQADHFTISVKIARASTAALRQAVDHTSIVVVGEPGAGKSGGMHDLAVQLIGEGKDVVLLAADQLAAATTATLQSDLGLAHRLHEVLINWPGNAAAYLLIDALDAARSEGSTQTLRDLIRFLRSASPRWRVVASIRQFDLRYSVELREIFAGSPPSKYQLPEFSDIQHVFVSKLTGEELHQIAHQSPELWQVISNAEEGLRELVTSPFNLRIIASLVAAGVPSNELTPIKTQLDLLNRYWLERIIRDDGLGDARETVLRDIASAMVRQRSLHAERARFASITNSTILANLLKNGVLFEYQRTLDSLPDRETLVFSHHVLFDYAIARLLLKAPPGQTRLPDLFGHEPDLVIAIRPSLTIHFQMLWIGDLNRNNFWAECLQTLQSANVPEIAKLIGPTIAADLTNVIADIRPIFELLETGTEESRDRAIKALRHVFGAILTTKELSPHLWASRNQGIWCEVLAALSQHIDEKIAYLIRPLIFGLCDEPDRLSEGALANLGLAARQLLEHAWRQPLDRWDYWLTNHALRCVCRTGQSNKQATADLLRQGLTPEHVQQHGYQELPTISHEISRLIALDPDLVRDIYIATYIYRDTSNTPTAIGNSRILPMISNRGQDYDMARYALGEAYWVFINRAPQQAVVALIAAVNAYIEEKHPTGESPTEEFRYNDTIAHFRQDISSVWDYSTDAHTDYEASTLLRIFTRYIDEVSKDPQNIPLLQSLLDIIVAQNSYAAIWRRLLISGRSAPHTIGRLLLPLLSASPILTNFDTSSAAGNLLTAIFGFLSQEERHQIETTIFQLPNGADGDDQNRLEHIRNKLLGNISADQLVTDEARHLVSELQSTGTVPPNTPPFSMGETTWVETTEDDRLSEQGVPDSLVTSTIRALMQPVQAFVFAYKESLPPLETSRASLGAFQALYAGLQTSSESGVHPALALMSWGYLLEACELIAKSEGLQCTSDLGRFLMATLLAASESAQPSPSDRANIQFEQLPSWEAPAPRITAASGLMFLARNPSCFSDEVRVALERLSTDPVTAVRFQVAIGLNMLYKTAPDWMWIQLTRICTIEPSRAIVVSVLRGPLRRIARSEPERVLDLLEIVQMRHFSDEAADLREIQTSIELGLYLAQLSDRPATRLFEIVSNPKQYSVEVGRLVVELRDWLRPSNRSSGQGQRPGEQRAKTLFQAAVTAICQAVSAADLQLREQGQNLSEEAVASGRSLYQLADNASMTLYFSSGAFDEKETAKNPQPPLSLEQKRAFFVLVSDAILELAALAHPNVTHHLVETLESLVTAAPIDVFITLGQVVKAGSRGGYEFETLAADRIVAMVERYLAEFRSIFRENLQCQRVLVDILDVFVQAGWPSARHITYRLEEIYR